MKSPCPNQFFVSLVLWILVIPVFLNWWFWCAYRSILMLSRGVLRGRCLFMDLLNYIIYCGYHSLDICTDTLSSFLFLKYCLLMRACVEFWWSRVYRPLILHFVSSLRCVCWPHGLRCTFLCFPRESVVLPTPFPSIVHCEIIVCGARYGLEFSFSHRLILLFHVICKYTFFVFPKFVWHFGWKSKVCDFWGFHSVPLIFLSNFVRVPQCHEEDNFLISNEIYQCQSCTLVFLLLLMVCPVLGPCPFHTCIRTW